MKMRRKLQKKKQSNVNAENLKTSGKFDQDEADLKECSGFFKFRLKDTARKSFLDFVPVSIKINKENIGKRGFRGEEN